MEKGRTRTVIKIDGKSYNIVGAESEEHIQRVAAYVDRKMQEIGFATRVGTAQQTVLAALNIAEDLMRAQDENSRLRKELAQLRQEHAKLQK